MCCLSSDQLREELANTDNLLIVQDLDGVCMQLVKNPLTRRMDARYVLAAAKLEGELCVLTNGEHEGQRGINRLVELALCDKERPRLEGLYLPGLAAGGVQLQDRFGHLDHPGVSEAEMTFLAAVPARMKALLKEYLSPLLPELSRVQIAELACQSVLDTQVSPTVNLNGAFELVHNDIERQKELQWMLKNLMERLIQEAKETGLENSFFLHIAPNLGQSDSGCERLKFAVPGDVGTTDIQFMLTGSLKEAGLLMLINRHIACRTGKAPLGDDFNVRTAPHNYAGLLHLVRSHIPASQMPLIVGVGDTVTSRKANDGSGWLRGGSDRGFLTLLQDIGSWCGCHNRVILVDSSHGEINRPSFFVDGYLKGISDPEDPLHLDLLMPGGPDEYTAWFQALADQRQEKRSL
ncbi:glucosylglycerol 3-phosphatase [cyanobiont of Ornithocercus magnificus]|nr:glucosylglycerol 3-phosphatase [cyanobiont of Ornithocercus magnificus]